MGLGLGEAAWGVAQIIGGGALAGGGGTLAAGGGAASSTGIGAVVGAPAMALGLGAVGTGAAVMAEGGADIATGFGVFMSAWSQGGGGRGAKLQSTKREQAEKNSKRVGGQEGREPWAPSRAGCDRERTEGRASTRHEPELEPWAARGGASKASFGARRRRCAGRRRSRGQRRDS
jgi:hypothetical protein